MRTLIGKPSIVVKVGPHHLSLRPLLYASYPQLHLLFSWSQFSYLANVVEPPWVPPVKSATDTGMIDSYFLQEIVADTPTKVPLPYALSSFPPFLPLSPRMTTAPPFPRLSFSSVANRLSRHQRCLKSPTRTLTCSKVSLMKRTVSVSHSPIPSNTRSL